MVEIEKYGSFITAVVDAVVILCVCVCVVNGKKGWIKENHDGTFNANAVQFYTCNGIFCVVLCSVFFQVE